MAQYEMLEPREAPEVRCDALKVGEVAVCTSVYTGEIFLKTFAGIVSLSNPEHTWDNGCSLVVRRLAPGTVIKLRVRDND